MAFAGVPLKPMLASITEGVPDALKQLQGQWFLAEFKYDGIRAQARPPALPSWMEAPCWPVTM